MDNTFNIYEVKTNFSKLAERVAKGEEIIVAKAGKPYFKMTPLTFVATNQPKRLPGLGKGTTWQSKDCWAPMTKKELREWNDAPLFPPRKKTRKK